MEAVVVFQPSGRRGRVPLGITVVEGARLLGVDLTSPCGGQGTCGKCLVSTAGGGLVLACRERIQGDTVYTVPEGATGGRTLVRKESCHQEIPLDPPVRAVTATTAAADLNHPVGDWERVQGALASLGEKADRVDAFALGTLTKAIRGNQVTVLLREGEAVGFCPPNKDGLFGAAVDLGTTTIALYLCDLVSGEVVAEASAVNPQVAYGDDVMSRITVGMTDPRGLASMRDSVRRGVQELLEEACGKVSVPREAVAEMVVVANTVMHHIFIGVDPEPLGLAPFVPVVQGPLEIKARDLGLAILPGGYVYLPPNKGGFLGADNMAALLAERPYEAEERVLFIDVGTNGEMEAGNREGLLACSCPTGPALEGAHIQHGMRAAAGAIDQVSIDRVTWEPSLRVIGDSQPKGLCGSAIIDTVAQLHQAGILRSDGGFQLEREHPRLRRNGQSIAEYVLCWAEESATGEDIVFTLKDVRAVQLAKGALYAGARILMNRLGWDSIDRVVLAGGFGSYIDPHSAINLGLIPLCEPDQVVAVGNAAGAGARMLLMSREQRKVVAQLPERVELVELTLDESFQTEFMTAMYLP